MLRMFLKNIFKSIKKIYFNLFNFIIGKEEKRFGRFFVHVNTFIIIFIIPPTLLSLIIQEIKSEHSFFQSTRNILLTLFIIILYLLLVKFKSHYFSNK